MNDRRESRTGEFSLDTTAELTEESLTRLLRAVVAGYIDPERAAAFILAWSHNQFERQLEKNLETFFGNG